MAKLHVYKSEKETCYAFAGWFAELVDETLKKQPKFCVALSGGDTPKLFYKVLASDYADKIEWSKIEVFWGDEKFVSSSESTSNAALAEKLLFENINLPAEQIHEIRTDKPPEEASKEYEQLLRSYFKGKEHTFDLVILGMGKDGNTLSLFPGHEENNERTSWVIPVYNKEEDLFRITLTSPVINASKVKAFLITGKNKQDAVQHALKGKY